MGRGGRRRPGEPTHFLVGDVLNALIYSPESLLVERTLGVDRVADLRPFTAAAPLPDSTRKYLAFDHVGRYFAMVVVSPDAAPSVVARQLERQDLARRVLGPLGHVILEPLQSGTVDGLTYAIYPFCQPVYKSRVAWALQRVRLRQAVLTWLRAATEATLDRPTTQEREQTFAEPLRHIAALEVMPKALRDGASAALMRLEAGAWEPRICLMHGDLWRGNLLLAPGCRRWDRFAIIDWGGSLVHGYGIFDLIRLAISMKLTGRRLEREVRGHCRILGCDLIDAPSYLLAALGYTGMNLDHFPLDRFVEMSSGCWDHLNSVGANGVVDGRIPNYLTFPEKESEESSSSLRRLNEAAVRDGWRCALDENSGFEPGRVRYATDPARHTFVDLLPLTKESTILEIGSSLGQITTALADRAGFVHGLEPVPGQAEFAAERCRQEGLDNVALTCGGDDCRLPYEDGRFDGVVINLVLEWCGERDRSTGFIECQRRLLRECNRVLKPDGWFYLTTKNRYGWHYLIGKGDEHTFGWRFGQALPRWLLAALMKCRGKSRTGGLVHSYWALQRLLREAGFGELRSYWAVPEYRFPRELIPADAQSIRAARRRPDFVQGYSRTTNLLMPLTPARLVKYVMPGLTFLAKKSR